MGVCGKDENREYLLMHQQVRQMVGYGLQPELHHVRRRGEDGHLESMSWDITQIHEEKHKP